MPDDWNFATAILRYIDLGDILAILISTVSAIVAIAALRHARTSARAAQKSADYAEKMHWIEQARRNDEIAEKERIQFVIESNPHGSKPYINVYNNGGSAAHDVRVFFDGKSIANSAYWSLATGEPLQTNVIPRLDCYSPFEILVPRGVQMPRQIVLKYKTPSGVEMEHTHDFPG